jgi:hypothetical protein
MAYITRQDPAYALANSQNEQGAYNGFDQYLSQTPMVDDYWRSLGYTGPMDEASIQQWMASQGMQTGFDPANAQNALMGASGPVAGSTYSVDDTGDFMRDALLTAGGGYFGGSALSGLGATAPTLGGLQGAIAQGAVTGGAAGGGIGALGATGQLGAGLGAVGGAAAAGNSGGYQLDPNSFGGANYGGGNMAGNSGTSLADFFSGGGSTSDYLRLAQGIGGLYANNRAADAAQGGEANRLALLERMYTDTRKDNQPLLDLRNSTLPQINALMTNPGSITSQPDYQFGLKQGQSQIDNQAAARGGYYSGAQMKASQRFGQDYAGTKLTDSLNRLMGVAGLGQVGATGNANNNAQFGQQAGNSMVNTGNIRGSGYMGGFNTANNGVNSWMQDSYWDQMLKGGGG